MSPVVLALDLLLASLLVLTLVLGVRLNGRLKGLKQSHAGFEKAVAELNQAAARAEAGLAALRETSAEAHDALLARIDTARSLVTRLERANFQAEKAAEAVVRAKAELPSVAASRADAAVSRLAMSGPPAPSAPAPAASMPNALATIAALVGDGPAAGARPGAGAGSAPQSGATSPSVSPRRGRSAFDEDLFESDEPGPAPRAASRSTDGVSLSGLRGRPKDDRR
jgi:hypothetical protein